MKTLTCCAVLLLTAASALADDTTRLWYRRPAAAWNQALPVGNGRLGAMVFGGVQEERIQLNEDTVWAGEYRDRVNPQAAASLAEVRRLLTAGRGGGGAGARRQDDGVDPAADAAVPDRRRPAAVVPAAGRVHAVRARPRPRHGRRARPLRVGRRRPTRARCSPRAVHQAIVIRLAERHAGEAVVLGHAPPRAGRGDAHGRRRPARDAGLGDPADGQLRPRTPDGRRLPRGDAGGRRPAGARAARARASSWKAPTRPCSWWPPRPRCARRTRRRACRRAIDGVTAALSAGHAWRSRDCDALARGARRRLPALLPPRRASPRRARVGPADRRAARAREDRRRRSPAGGALLPVRPLPADLEQPPGHDGRRTCRGSGTTRSRRRGTASTRSTSTPR